MQDEITYDVFKSFLCCKAFDVIGNGSYKTFLVRCRDNNDTWAIETHHNVQCVTEKVKGISSVITQLRRNSAYGLGAICKDLITNTTPPVFSSTNWNVCQISGQHTDSCVELLKSQHKTANPVFVHSKYMDFLNMLWYVCKIEHIIRNFTRQWLRVTEPHETGSERNIAEICQTFSEQEEAFTRLYKAFKYGSEYVKTSLKRYNEAMQGVAPLRF